MSSPFPPAQPYNPTGPVNWGQQFPQAMQSLQQIVQSLNAILQQLKTITPSLTQGSAQSGITAFATGGQASATQLSAQFNLIGTVATAADSIALPVSAAGRIIYIANRGANAVQVFGVTPDTINGVATGTGVSLGANKSAAYFCPVAGQWFSIPTAP